MNRNSARLLAQNPHVLKRLAKYMAQQCFRNTVLEDFHAGITPYSQAGDYSDVFVKTPAGEIPWSKLSRLSDEEMKTLMWSTAPMGSSEPSAMRTWVPISSTLSASKTWCPVGMTLSEGQRRHYHVPRLTLTVEIRTEFSVITTNPSADFVSESDAQI
jgi:hypothetical protein